MNIPGVRFNISERDLEGHQAPNAPPSRNNTTADASLNILVSDVLEHSSSSQNAKPPSAPAPPSLAKAAASKTGFPAPMKRKDRSAGRQQRNNNNHNDTNSFNTTGRAKMSGMQTNQRNKNMPVGFDEGGWNDGYGNAVDFDKMGIGAMNNQWIESLSERDLQRERDELMDTMSPELLKMFMKRAEKARTAAASSNQEDTRESKDENLHKEGNATDKEDISTSTAATTLQPSSEVRQPKEVKFDLPDPDPESPAFLSQLHEKYYPDLPVEPSKMAWMKPANEQDPTDNYSPSMETLVPSAIRFDFRGKLVPPRTARELPTHLGLHHHGDAPLSAGYTIPELAHLARSSFPAQRCMSFQTLGRILYRLGVGNYTVHGGSRDLEDGLWRCIVEGKVKFTLEEAVGGGFGGRGDPHLGVKSYATEALWLWQKGGGKYLIPEDDNEKDDA